MRAHCGATCVERGVIFAFGTRPQRCEVRNRGGMVELRDSDSGLVVVPSVLTADMFSLRAMRGLIGRASVEPGEGLLLRDPLGCIHTFGMRCSIDIVFLSRRLQVREVAAQVPPRRLRWAWRGAVQLELAAGQAGCLGLYPGRRLALAERPFETLRGHAELQSPHTEGKIRDLSHLCLRAPCAALDDVPTVPPWPQREAPQKPEALPAVTCGSTRRRYGNVCKPACS